MIRNFASLLLPRFLRFRREIVVLWRAFWSAGTPLYLKLATIAAAVYLVNPFDIVPDFIPFLGWIDDIVIVPLVVSWIVSRLPRDNVPAERSGPIIDGTARKPYPPARDEATD